MACSVTSYLLAATGGDSRIRRSPRSPDTGPQSPLFDNSVGSSLCSLPKWAPFRSGSARSPHPTIPFVMVVYRWRPHDGCNLQLAGFYSHSSAGTSDLCLLAVVSGCGTTPCFCYPHKHSTKQTARHARHPNGHAVPTCAPSFLRQDELG